MYIYKLKFAVAGVVLASIGSTLAGERLPEYVYHSDGTYSPKGSGNSNVNESWDADGLGSNNETVTNGAGFLETTTGFSSNHDNENSVDSYGLRGSYGRVLENQWVVQGDAKYEYLEISNGTSSGDIDELAATLHVSKKLNDKFAAGAFIQGGLIGKDFWTQYSGGLEAAAFLDSATLYGRVAYSKATVQDEDADSIIGTLGARVYANDNLRFDVEGKYWEDNAQVGVAGLYRFANYNTTLTLGYRYDHNSAGVESQSASTIFTGIRYHFGAKTLRQEERSGVQWGFVR